jgi:hypothetical protein
MSSFCCLEEVSLTDDVVFGDKPCLTESVLRYTHQLCIGTLRIAGVSDQNLLVLLNLLV